MLNQFYINSAANIAIKSFFGLFVFFGMIVPACGQITENAQVGAVQTADKISEKPVVMPVSAEYKGVKIGATADQVRDLLGKAKLEDKEGFFYDRDDEMVQIRLDADKKVMLISTTYSGEDAPKFADVFGMEITAPAKPDGSIYKLVEYPKAGYWVAYSRAAGEKPAVTVTIQKL